MSATTRRANAKFADFNGYPPLERQRMMWERATALVNAGIAAQSQGDTTASEQSLEDAVEIMEAAMEIQFDDSEFEEANRLNKKMKRYVKMIKSQREKGTSASGEVGDQETAMQQQQPNAGRPRDNYIDWQSPNVDFIPVIQALENSTLCGDICETLCRIFGFQEQNAVCQKEHVVLLLGNAKYTAEGSSLFEDEDAGGRGGGGKKDSSPLETAIQAFHKRLFDNYTKWCKYVGSKPSFTQEKLIDIVLFLLIWGEAANFRHTPEYLCFLFHKMSSSAAASLGRQFQPAEPGAFLATIIRPMYDEFSKENSKKTLKGARAEHSEIRNYDDFNEFFWTKKCLKYNPGNAHEALGAAAKNGKPKIAKKTFIERRSWLRLLLSYRRVFYFSCALFLACIGFCVNMTVLCPEAMILYRLQTPPSLVKLEAFGHKFYRTGNGRNVTYPSNAKCNPMMLAVCLGIPAASDSTLTAKKFVPLPQDFVELTQLVDFGQNSGGSDSCVAKTSGRCGCFLDRINRCFQVEGSFSTFDKNTKTVTQTKTYDQSTCFPDWYQRVLSIINDDGPGYLNCNTCGISLSSVPAFQKLGTGLIQNPNGPMASYVMFLGIGMLFIMLFTETQRSVFSHVGLGFVGKSLPLPWTTTCKTLCFWWVLAALKVSVSYNFMIKALVEASIFIWYFPDDIALSYYRFLLPMGFCNIDYLLAIWLPSWMVFMYDIQIWYSLLSVIVGGIKGFNLKVGEVRSFRILRQTFKSIPREFNRKIVANYREVDEEGGGKRKKKKKRAGNKASAVENAASQPMRFFERISYTSGPKPLLVETMKYTALLARSPESPEVSGVSNASGDPGHNPHHPYAAMSTPQQDSRMKGGDAPRFPGRGSSSSSLMASVTGLSGPNFERTIAFATAWNKALQSLRAADIINNRELNVLRLE